MQPVEGTKRCDGRANWSTSVELPNPQILDLRKHENLFGALMAPAATTFRPDSSVLRDRNVPEFIASIQAARL